VVCGLFVCLFFKVVGSCNVQQVARCVFSASLQPDKNLCVLLTDGIVDVIIYNSPDDVKKKNRGFAFLEYDSHKSASMAKHRIGNGYTRVWGCDIIVDWADPQEEPDEETMSKVVT